MTKKEKDTLKKIFHISGIIYYVIVTILIFVTVFVLADWYNKIQQMMEMVP